MQAVGAEDLLDVVEMPTELAECAANQTVSFLSVHHDSADGGGVGAHDGAGKVGRDAVPRAQLVIASPVVAISRVVFGVYEFTVIAQSDRKPCFFDAHLHDLGPADEDRPLRGFFQHGLRRAQHPFVLAFGKYDATGRGTGGLEYGAHEKGGLEDRAVQLLAVGVQVLDGARRDAGFHCGLGHGGRDHTNKARIKGFRDQVIGAKGHLFALIGRGGLGGGGGASEFRNPVDAGQLHGVVDGGGTCIQCPTEDERET